MHTMARGSSVGWREGLLWGSLGLYAAIVGARLLTYESNPWGWVITFAVISAVLLGAVTWLARARVPVEHREKAEVGLVIGLLLCFPFVLVVGLLYGSLFWLDTALLGGLLGGGLVVMASRTVL